MVALIRVLARSSVVVLGLSVCAPGSGQDTEPTKFDPASDSTPSAASESESESESESAASHPESESETGADTDTETETETGSDSTDVPEAGGARLCSVPLSLSWRPGKGSGVVGEKSERLAQLLTQGFEVQIDELERQAWTSKAGIEFDALDPTQTHRIVIYSRKRRIQSLRLDFAARGGDDLCLQLETDYWSWQLRETRPRRRCGPCVTR